MRVARSKSACTSAVGGLSEVDVPLTNRVKRLGGGETDNILHLSLELSAGGGGGDGGGYHDLVRV